MSDTGGSKQIVDNACKSTVDTVKKVTDTIADKYALELQATMKKEKLLQLQGPDNTLCIGQNVPLFGARWLINMIMQNAMIYCNCIEC